MYLRECFIENIGPISSLDLFFDVNPQGAPKPVILVGKNGAGKTILLSYVLDALAEFVKPYYTDVVQGQRLGHMPYLRTTSGGNTRSLSGNSLVLLAFADTVHRCHYIEKVGAVDESRYAERLADRFQSVRPWPTEETPHKKAIGREEKIKSYFTVNSVCYFPSSRHELPHWLNKAAVIDQPVFDENRRISGILGKPLIIERSADDNRQWLMNVLFDSLVDANITTSNPVINGAPPLWQVQPRGDLEQKRILQICRHNVEELLRAVLEDEQAQLILNFRGAPHGRVSIQLSDQTVIPSLSHLSAGQALLFNMFATIIRYADLTDVRKSITLSDIGGIVLIDEVDAHLHTDLQYEVLPRLIKLFPKVQFIVTSHSPLFLLGMEKAFGTDGVQIIEMPTGRQIGTERFEEFQRSFEHYRKTQTFETELQAQILATNKPLILTEGQTDVLYIHTALELLGHTELLSAIEIYQVGKPGKDGAKGGGHTNLDAARKFLEHNHDRFPRQILFLYDCDTQKETGILGSLMFTSIPQNPLNTKVPKGIENLLPPELFAERFYSIKKKPGDYGGEISIPEFRKVDFCDWVCKERRNKDDFQHFDTFLIPILRNFLHSTAADAKVKDAVVVTSTPVMLPQQADSNPQISP